MIQPPKDRHPKPSPSHPDPAIAERLQRKKAETGEVLGRHKNTGQKDHKGAR